MTPDIPGAVMHRHNGESVNLNFAMRRTKARWKAYEVAIDGTSYDKSFRDGFGEEIEQKGLNEVTARLESFAAPDCEKLAHC